MNVKRFIAGTSREALGQIRLTLGPDAIILSNKNVDDGVEIMAMSNAEITSFLGNAQKETQRKKTIKPIAQALDDAPIRDKSTQKTNAQNEHVPSGILDEIKSMRSMLQDQLATMAWQEIKRYEPAKAKILRNMLSAGFSPLLTRQLLQTTPTAANAGALVKHIEDTLNGGLNVVTNDEDIIDRGGVYALVGPTGVGKTTTTAKLAARCVVRHGADKLALVTTDTYRIGAHEQLRIYGKILGVPVYAIKDTADLRLTLGELRNKYMVLIDTVGMSQKDRLVADQAAMLCGGGDVKRLLLLSATSSGDTLDDVVRAYQGKGMAGCIITKLDEANNIGSALDTVVRHKLTVHYITNGQRVPEDMHLANRQYLLHRALKLLPEDSAHAIADGECPVMMTDMFQKTQFQERITEVYLD